LSKTLSYKHVTSKLAFSKFHPFIGHEGPLGESRGIALLYF
jgi:hypothetical protein